MPKDDGNNRKRPDFKDVGERMNLKRLEDLLKERDNILKNTIREKTNLEAENLNLKNEIKQKRDEIQNFKTEKALIEDKYKKISDLDKKVINEKDSEIRKLKKQLDEVSLSKSSDEQILKELTNTKLQLQEVKLHNNLKMEELIETRSKLEIKEEKLAKMTHEIENLNKIIADYQFEKVDAKNELDLIKSKLKTSFTPEEMSGYLNSTIESFNNQVNTVDTSVNYVINGMDVDLKTQVFKDDQSRIMFSSADIGSKSEKSISSVKFSIRAVPKL